MTCVPVGVLTNSIVCKQMLPSLEAVPGRQKPGGGADGVRSETASGHL